MARLRNDNKEPKDQPKEKKKSKDVNIHREWVKLWLGIFLTFFGMGIVGYGIIAEPQGKIDYSVVSTFGVIMTWAGTMFGFDSHAKIRMHEQDLDFEAKKQEQADDFEIRSRELDEKMRQFDIRYRLGEDEKESET